MKINISTEDRKEILCIVKILKRKESIATNKKHTQIFFRIQNANPIHLFAPMLYHNTGLKTILYTIANNGASAMRRYVLSNSNLVLTLSGIQLCRFVA